MIKKIRSRAPLRLGLAGGGSDVSPYSDNFGGCVLNVTISLYAYCTLESYKENEIQIISKDMGCNTTLPFNLSYFELNGELDIIKQTINHFINRGYIKNLSGLKITTYCDAPPGSGLGTSSAVVVALVKALIEWYEIPMGDYEIANTAYIIERQELEYAGGKQDQYAATFGGLNFMEFFEDERVIINPIRLKSRIIREFHSSITLFNLGTSRKSANIILDQNKSLEKESRSLDAMHLIKQSAINMKEQLINGNILNVSKILADSWESKKRLTKRISNSQINHIHDQAILAGADAGKISGAGGGGVMFFLSDPTKKISIIQAMKRNNVEFINFEFVNSGCVSWQI